MSVMVKPHSKDEICVKSPAEGRSVQRTEVGINEIF